MTNGAAGHVDLHQEVSNQPETVDEAVTEESVSSPPDQGAEGTVEAAPTGGLEAVVETAGPRIEMTAAEAFTAPDTGHLRPIGEASYGAPAVQAESVHGPDDRIQIQNTSAYPWRVHASLLITARDNSQWIGTGWFIGPRTLVTAGHVVYIKNSGVEGRDGFVKSMAVMPGRNGTSLPYGSVTATNFRTVVGWATSGDQHYDYGAIILPTNLGSRTGWFGFGAYSDATLRNSHVNISGYPGDKPSGTQWYDHQRVASVGPRKVYYDIDTYGGQSGSAVYRITDTGRYGVAVHAYGGATTNSGTRITKPVFDNFVNWKS